MMRYSSSAFILPLLLAALPSLHGCAPLVIGGAAATGVLVSEDRRTVGTITEDQAIESKASSDRRRVEE